MSWWPALIAILASGLTTILVVPVVVRLANHLGALDHPGPRKSHHEPVPRLGGLAIVSGIAVGTLFAMMADSWQHQIPARQVGYFAVALLIILVIGVLDDLNGVSVLQKFLAQILAAILVIQAGWQIEVARFPFLEDHIELGSLVGPLVSLLWIVGVTNAINLLDGLDGLANGIVAIVALTIMSYALPQGSFITAIVTGAMAGACLAFLRFNWEPADIFMGDSGSLTLGFALASLTLNASLKTSTAVAILVPILALGLPVIDTLLVMAFRFIEGSGSPFPERIGGMFKADQKHLHHLALFLAPKRRQIVLWLYGLALVFCLMAMWVAIKEHLTLGIWLLIIEILAVMFIRKAGMKAEARKQALRGREEARRMLADAGS